MLTAGSDIVHLEQRVNALENQARQAPGSSDTSPDDAVPRSGTEISLSNSSASTHDQVASAITLPPYESDSAGAIGTHPLCQPTHDLVETISFGCEDDTLRGHDAASVYRGKSTGIETLRNLRRLCSLFVGSLDDPDHSAIKMANALDSSPPVGFLSPVSLADVCFWSEAHIRRWIGIAFEEAFSLWPFIDRHEFTIQVERLFEQKSLGRGDRANDHMGLIHAVIALGQRYDPDLVNIEGHGLGSTEARG